jgi:hypothetical protein
MNHGRGASEVIDDTLPALPAARRIRVSVGGLMAAVGFLALAFASLLNANPLWASGMFLLAVAVMSAATLGAISGCGRARMARVGVALFGWVYLGIFFGPLENGNGTTIPALPTMVVYEYTMRENLIPRSKAANKSVGFRNATQSESLLPKASLVGKPAVLVDVMDLKRIVHSLGALAFASLGGLLGGFFHARDSRAEA